MTPKMTGPRSKRFRKKDHDFLFWAKQQHGTCCVCRHLYGEYTPAQELHHWGEKGMGQKCDDYFVCRLCVKCHREHQGKKGMAFHRARAYELWAAMSRDCAELLAKYIDETRG